MRVIVSRPEREARGWSQQLSARGFDVLALPLIEIGPVTDPLARQALDSAWQRLDGYFAIMFVSGNAVMHFFASKPSSAHIPRAWSAINSGIQKNFLPRCWAPGPGTVRALQHAGVAAHAIDAPDAQSGQFDSEALWQQVHARVPPGARVLIVRGADEGTNAGRDWLAHQLAAAAAQVETVAAYERRVPVLEAQQLALAQQAAQDGSVWLFSSSQAIRHLAQLLPAQHWGRARAVATHPRIAQTARQAGFGVVCESRPTLDDVVASIESVP
ncbi:uroporphyrinogen-III synthase [Polaromonas sp. C04]|uniref:uroporphyrinogen-III synthase n=1 Tax=Polaromonas sp. C04 TaxID=1945857 RepID=UPI0009846319|nr:uroporphyrinogen-III synthase [Polaromonas sp. C04]OOG52029.1 uroporphyrinogen III synthase [Polaromonas sp. C04]